MRNNGHTTKQLRAIIAGGGTGGHVFPAIAIAKALKEKVQCIQILFVGAKGRMEMEKVPKAGFHIIGLDIAGLHRGIHWKNLLLPWKIIKSVSGARKIVKRFKPDIVIGVGGYASGPVLWASARLKVPVLIQEQNAYPGLTNRMLAKKAKRICVAYEGMDAYFPKHKIFLTGNPVRQEVTETVGKREQAHDHFGLTPGRPVVLVTGGSLGARTINEAVTKHLGLFMEKDIRVIWQTGKTYLEEATKITSLLRPGTVHVAAFIDRMDFAYAAADVVVSRAGAIAVSEICAARVPAILVPSPHVAEDHQTKNAQTLANHHAAILLPDADAREELGKEVVRLIFDDERKHRLREKLAGLYHHNAANAIASVALGMSNAAFDIKLERDITNRTQNVYPG